MKRTWKDISVSWAGYILMGTYYVLLTAFVLSITMAGFFPDASYFDYVPPAFGIIFGISAGVDIANIKVDIALQRERLKKSK